MRKILVLIFLDLFILVLDFGNLINNVFNDNI